MGGYSIKSRKVGLKFLPYRFFVLPIVFLAFTSCGKKDSDLIVSMAPNQSQLYDGDAFSCINTLSTDPDKSKDVTGPFFSFPRISVGWKKNDGTSFNFTSVKFKLRGPNFTGGEFTCSLSLDEINALFSVANNDGYSNLSITKEAVITSNPACRVLCGGVSLVDKDNLEFGASGIVEIRGVAVDANEKLTRQVATAPISIIP